MNVLVDFECLINSFFCSSGSDDSQASKYALSGAFESITIIPPLGRLTIISGRISPSSPCFVVCSIKSTCFCRPASSTIFLSFISPHRPLVDDERSAFSRSCAVSWSSFCARPSCSSSFSRDLYAPSRLVSISLICLSSDFKFS